MTEKTPPTVRHQNAKTNWQLIKHEFQPETCDHCSEILGHWDGNYDRTVANIEYIEKMIGAINHKYRDDETARERLGEEMTITLTPMYPIVLPTLPPTVQVPSLAPPAEAPSMAEKTCPNCGHARRVHSRNGCVYDGACPYGCTLTYMDLA